MRYATVALVVVLNTTVCVAVAAAVAEHHALSALVLTLPDCNCCRNCCAALQAVNDRTTDA
eukprot:4740-Heterococcus_DN1.PRE.2